MYECTNVRNLASSYYKSLCILEKTPITLTIDQHFHTITTSLKMSNLAAFLETEKGQIVVRDAEIPEPGEGEVLIKVFACGIQPADVKVAKHAMLAIEYPTIVGSPVAGVVEAVGPGVTKVSVGERVVCGTKIFVQKKAKYGGLQRFTLVDAWDTVEVISSRIPRITLI
jgi:NADPH:quinone reductase-like Zn-dependent oxidoreductase